MYEQGEFRKFLLAIFVTLVNAGIVLTAMLSPDTNGMNYAAFTFAVGTETLMIQYYFRTKSPGDPMAPPAKKKPKTDKPD